MKKGLIYGDAKNRLKNLNDDLIADDDDTHSSEYIIKPNRRGTYFYSDQFLPIDI